MIASALFRRKRDPFQLHVKRSYRLPVGGLKDGDKMTQATAARERRRRNDHLRGQGMPTVYTGGTMWSLPKRQFQALYKAIGSYEEALELRPVMIPWPPMSDGREWTEEDGAPPPHVIYSWARELDAGEIEVDPKLFKIMEDRLMRMFSAQVRKGIVQSSKALQHLGKKVIDGTLDPKTQSQILSLGQAVNYGVGNYATFHKAVTAPRQDDGSLPLGGLTINIGQRPPPRKLRAREPLLIEGEFREVGEKVDSGSSA